MINMLIMSRWMGRNSRTHLQFDTIRKLQSTYGNQVRSSPQSTRTVMASGDQKGRYLRFSTDPVALMWFHRFLEGCHYRMGQEWQPNQAMSLALLVATARSIEGRIESSPLLGNSIVGPCSTLSWWLRMWSLWVGRRVPVGPRRLQLPLERRGC